MGFQIKRGLHIIGTHLFLKVLIKTLKPKSVPFYRDLLVVIDVCHPHGMMELRNDGIMGNKSGKGHIDGFSSS